ncbi:unnamed protein product [Rhizophagus irregularis]|nr:unnamed protein product [Rhizophagus irregularis]
MLEDFLGLVRPYGICINCDYVCYAMRFQQNWASGNDDIDKFIQDTQLSAHDDVNKALEWIPYNKLYDIEYITKDELGKVYRAIWIDGNIGENYYKFCSWSVNNNWIRRNPNMFVKLRSLTSPNDLTFELANKIKIEYEFYGMTQDPETKNYMMVLNNKYNICKKCNSKMCNVIHFQQKFIDWTSGNDDIDKFIQDTQLSAHDKDKALEWITYDRFYDIKYIAKGGFGKIYRANLTDGFITRWDDINQNWKRNSKDMLVALKSLDDSKNIESEFINETMLHNKVRKDNNCIIKLYGITQDPETKNYMMVLDYAEDGSLRNYLDKEYSRLNWIKKIDYLRYIIIGLECIHEKELIHRDLHIGNILKLRYKTVITDMGLCKPANYNALENTKNNIYGILPYIAPEILRGQNYTKAADIYSFGIIMYEMISGLPPYHDLGHNEDLAIKICQGLRPRFNIKVPQLIVHLIKRCLDANPFERPIAKEINNILLGWQGASMSDNQTTKIKMQIEEADKVNKNSPNSIPLTSLGLSYKTHSEAIYTSRLLNYNNLPEPKNSDDYYKQNDNIISKEFSESLQINISQLNINKSESLQLNISQLNINENESSQLNISQLNISENESSQINASQLNINDNESLQIDVSRLNINENESLQIDISQLNVNENGQNNESESKRKNCFLSQNNESERKKIRIE